MGRALVGSRQISYVKVALMYVRYSIPWFIQKLILKTRVTIFALLILAPFVSSYAAEASESESKIDAVAAQKKISEGETFWIEKQMTPATRWAEDLVKPLTTWMERKIQDRDTPPEIKANKPWLEVQPGTPRIQQSNDNLITSRQASQVAQQFVAGEVLRVKLLDSALAQYRVKMISNTGEIRMLYIDAHSGELIHPLNAKSEL